MADTPSTVAVIADVHGNRWALEAVLEDIQRRGIQQIINLGDSLLGPLDPAGTADIFIQRHIPSICGNDDRVYITPPATPSKTQLHTQQYLTDEHLQWLRSLPDTLNFSDNIFACHGTPTSDTTYLLEDVSVTGVTLNSIQAISTHVANITQPIILCAHSHIPRTVYLPSQQMVVNPGSVGLPAYTDDLPYPHAMASGSPHAKYVILRQEGESWLVEHIFMPYNWEKAAQAARDQRFPHWSKWIKEGRA